MKKSHIISVGDINLLSNLLCIDRDHVKMLFYIIAKATSCKLKMYYTICLIIVKRMEDTENRPKVNIVCAL